MDTTDSDPIPHQSPIREIPTTSFSSDNLQVTAADQTTPPDHAVHSTPKIATETTPPNTSTPTTTDQLLLEYIAATQKQIRLLTADRTALISNVSTLNKAVSSLSEAYHTIQPWSVSVTEKVASVADASAALHNAVAQLASTSTNKFNHQAAALTTLTKNQNDLAVSVSNYLFNTDAIVKVLPEMVDHIAAIRDEVSALRVAGTDMWTSQGEEEEEEEDISVSDPDMPPSMTDPLTDKAHNEIVFTTYVMRPIAERPHLEALAVAELSWIDMDTASDEVDAANAFPEFSAEELRNYNGLVREWAADENARVVGTSVSYELARWEWLNSQAADEESDDEEDDTIMHDADDNDNDDGGQGGDNGQQSDDDDEDDTNMDDQQPISSVIKRKRTSDTSAASAPPSKKQQVSVPRLNIVTSGEPEPSSAPATISLPTPPATTQITTTPATTQITQTIPQVQNATIPSVQTTKAPATITLSSTSTPSNFTLSDTSITAYLSSDSASDTLCPGETNEQRVARKIKARQDREKEMIMQIAFQADLKEEQERKRLLKEQSDADREYMMQLSSKEADERARLLQEKKIQEESDAAISRILTELEESELAEHKVKSSASKSSKKAKGAVRSAVDRKWDEIDRKRFAARMTGRSNPAPITKVKLKKSKNQSQPQLLIERGSQTQAMLLDQICKLHREEWNEIRLAISRSTSAAKPEVLKEIDRLFQKMVSLQLLRPEDTVILGEEIVQPPSPRYRSGTGSIHRIPNTSKLNLTIPAGIPRVEGYEVTEGEKGLVYRDLYGSLRFQREAELEKVDQEQLVHLIRSASMLPATSTIRKAILDEALARQFRYLPSSDKYELEAELGIVKEEEMWRDK